MALTGAFKFMPISYVDNPEKNETPHYFNTELANNFWGFRAFSKAEISDERTKMLMGGVENSKFDFITHAGQSLHWNPLHHAFSYKRASQGYFPDAVCTYPVPFLSNFYDFLIFLWYPRRTGHGDVRRHLIIIP
jgi:hypothetical protein